MSEEKYVPSDEDVRAVYNSLIGASWENADHFESHQNAWLVVADAWGVSYNHETGQVARFDPKERAKERAMMDEALGMERSE